MTQPSKVTAPKPQPQEAAPQARHPILQIEQSGQVTEESMNAFLEQTAEFLPFALDFFKYWKSLREIGFHVNLADFQADSDDGNALIQAIAAVADVAPVPAERPEPQTEVEDMGNPGEEPEETEHTE